MVAQQGCGCGTNLEVEWLVAGMDYVEKWNFMSWTLAWKLNDLNMHITYNIYHSIVRLTAVWTWARLTQTKRSFALLTTFRPPIALLRFLDEGLLLSTPAFIILIFTSLLCIKRLCVEIKRHVACSCKSHIMVVMKPTVQISDALYILINIMRRI